MVDELTGLNRVPDFLRGPVCEYAALLRETAGPNARSLTLFGTVVAGTFDPGRHTVRSVLLLGEIDLDGLRRLAERGAKLGKHYISAPLVMTPDYIAESLDTFPLELLEIQQRHVTLFGEDCFADLKFQAQDVRLQCEREMKVTLIGLRQGLLAAAGRERTLGRLQEDAMGALLRTLRGMLWLKGQTHGLAAPDVVDAVEHVTARRLDGLRSALDPTENHGWPQFERLYHDVAALCDVVNAW